MDDGQPIPPWHWVSMFVGAVVGLLMTIWFQENGSLFLWLTVFAVFFIPPMLFGIFRRRR